MQSKKNSKRRDCTDFLQYCFSATKRTLLNTGILAGLNRSIKLSYRKGNKSIEVIKPKNDWITSHTARRSICTNEFLASTPVGLIMKISDHKRSKDFYKYICISPEEVANEIKEL